MENLISINEAAEKGIERLKKPIWKMEEDHIKIDIIDKKPGPWIKLYSPFNQECNGRDPVNIPFFEIDGLNEKEFLPYTGPLPESEKYKNKMADFEGVINKPHDK